jgi:hypothetical protein
MRTRNIFKGIISEKGSNVQQRFMMINTGATSWMKSIHEAISAFQ